MVERRREETRTTSSQQSLSFYSPVSACSVQTNILTGWRNQTCVPKQEGEGKVGQEL